MLRLFQGPITGAKFAAIFVSFFGVIIVVNLALAYNAVATFPGLVVKNSYVASQTFDADRAAQLALGWQAEAQVRRGDLILTLTDANGNPVEDAEVTGVFGRATTVRDDQRPEFVFDGAVWRAPVTLPGGGNWDLHLSALAPDGTTFRQRLAVIIRADEDA